MATDPDADMMAAELALGLLDREDRAAALRRVMADPDFARDVERWRAHFGSLFAQYPSLEPPASTLARIEASLEPKKARSLLWPAIAAALAASLMVAVFTRPPPPVLSPVSVPTLVATLVPAVSGNPFPAVYDAARGEIRVASAGITAPGRSAELWIIDKAGAPRSLGLLAETSGSIITVKAANRAAIAAGNKLAISSEPEGGSPSGTPTGPIMAIGSLISV